MLIRLYFLESYYILFHRSRIRQEGEFPKFVFADPKKAAAIIQSRKVVDIDLVESLESNPPTRPLKPHEFRNQLTQQNVSSTLGENNMYGRSLTFKDIETINMRKGETGSALSTLSLENLDEVSEKDPLKKFWSLKKNRSEEKLLSGSVNDASASEEYYSTFFSDRERRGDSSFNQIEKLKEKHKNTLLGRETLRTRKMKIAPKAFWFIRSYSPPDPSTVMTMKSRALKFTLMNEARSVRLGGDINHRLWNALEARAAEIAPRVTLRSCLRFLQPIASVQRPMCPNIARLLDEIWRRSSDMRPKQHIFFMQALSRLRVRDPRLLKSLKDLSLVWPSLKTEFILRAANNVCKLDLAHEPLAIPLRAALVARLETISAKQMRRMKAVTMLEILLSEEVERGRDAPFDDNKYENALVKYLTLCVESSLSWQIRPYEIVEFHLRVVRPDVYAQLSSNVRDMLSRLRLVRKSLDDRKEAGRLGEDAGADEDAHLDFDDSDDDLMVGDTGEEHLLSEDEDDDIMISEALGGGSERKSFKRVNEQDDVHIPGFELARYETQVLKRPYDETLTHRFASDDALEAELKAEEIQKQNSDKYMLDPLVQPLIRSDSELKTPEARRASYLQRERAKKKVLMEALERKKERDPNAAPLGYSCREASEMFDILSNSKEYESLATALKDAGVSKMTLKHDIKAGPYKLDLTIHMEKKLSREDEQLSLKPLKIYSENLVVEFILDGQVYTGTRRITTAAGMRHKHLGALGMNLQFIDAKRWNLLETKEEKAQFIAREIFK